jgi:hypothetical protein
VTDITKRVGPPNASTFEASLARAKAWMRDNYDEHKITLSGEEARKFEERAIKAGFNIVQMKVASGHE